MHVTFEISQNMTVKMKFSNKIFQMILRAFSSLMEHQTLKNNAANKQPAFSSLMEHQTLKNNAANKDLR
jgi:hypothetical protein